MNEQSGENPEFTNSSETEPKIDGFTQGQVEATLKRLEEVLAEDTPKTTEDVEQTPPTDQGASLEALKRGLGEGNIELLPDEEAEDGELYSEAFIEGAKKALEQMLSPETGDREDETTQDSARES